MSPTNPPSALVYPPILDIPNSEPPQDFDQWRTNDRVKLTNGANKITLIAPPILEDAAAAEFASQGIPVYTHKLNADDWSCAPDVDEVSRYVTAFFGVPVDYKDFDLWLGSPTKVNFTFYHLTLYMGQGPDREVLGEIGYRCTWKTGHGQRWALAIEDLHYALRGYNPQDAFVTVQLIKQAIFIDAWEDKSPIAGVSLWQHKWAVVSICSASPTHKEVHDAFRPEVKVDDVNLLWPVPAANEILPVAPDVDEVDMVESPIYGALKTLKEFCSVPGGGTIYMDDMVGCYPSRAKVNMTEAAKADLWLTNLCSSVCHEVGHAFGLDHCRTYACPMNAGGPRRRRTPNLIHFTQYPVLCPECLEKIMWAVHNEPNRTKDQDGNWVLDAKHERARVEVRRYALLFHVNAIYFGQSQHQAPLHKAILSWIFCLFRRYDAEFLKTIDEIWQRGQFSIVPGKVDHDHNTKHQNAA